MKKALLALSAILFAFMACTEDPTNPDNPNGPDNPAGKGEFTLTSAATATLEAEGGDVRVEFTSTVDWTASLDVEAAVATLAPKSGSAEDTFVKVTVAAFDEKNTTRTIKLTIKPEGLDDVVVTITQNGEFEPYFRVSTTQLTGAVGQNTVSFTFETNTEYNVKTYEEFEEWAPFTIQDNVGTFTLAANPEFAERTAYVKFTVPAIQVAVLDDEGKDTGETEDAAFRVYVTQAGHAEVAWELDLPELVTEGATNFSLALYAGGLFVCNGSKLFAMTPTGDFVDVTPDELGDFVLYSITTDDAGDLLLQLGGEYSKTLCVMAIPSVEGREAGTIILCPNGAYGYGLNNIHAAGDVYGQAVVTMFQGGAPGYGGKSRGVYWNIGSGYAAWEQLTPGDDNSWVTKPTGDILPEFLGTTNLWDSIRCFFAPAGPRVSDGFYYGGYDGVRAIHYYDPAAESWSKYDGTAADGNHGYNSFDSITWGDETYNAFIEMSYFPKWAVPSKLWLVKGSGASAEPVAVLPYAYAAVEEGVSDARIKATDVSLTIEGDKMCAYVIDGAWNILKKYEFTK